MQDHLSTDLLINANSLQVSLKTLRKGNNSFFFGSFFGVGKPHWPSSNWGHSNAATKARNGVAGNLYLIKITHTLNCKYEEYQKVK
jgi:hypothetical protein